AHSKQQAESLDVPELGIALLHFHWPHLGAPPLSRSKRCMRNEDVQGIANTHNSARLASRCSIRRFLGKTVPKRAIAQDYYELSLRSTGITNLTRDNERASL